MPDTFETRRQNNEQAHRDVAGDSVRPGSLDPGLSTPADTALGDVVWLTEEEINFIENKGPDGSIDNDFAPPLVTDSVE